ncbi:zinc-ribbon domain-containing protein [Acidianus sulfidivorans JP7]|uniref:Zinc-ribbon domain-containing protein n=1 Tax=Acidianus sulfidivorans JP7 TaxID=619593 RepID=A0A2U9INC6_9CREN|nr:zinc ribbon domain-containing protein [Acidianus sulfidivorans]AWR97454.1 zinc-ribbon domain-containing protein [Acidianus sulfidivorans JP7]
MSYKKIYKREDLVGKQVINQEGNIVGIVKDTGYDAEGKMAIIVATKDNKEEYYSITEIRGIGDVIVLRDIQTQAPVNGIVCPNCGYLNPAGSNYCIRCGAKLNSFF